MQPTLHRPVYLKGQKMLEAPIPMRPPVQPPPSPPPQMPTPSPSTINDEDESEEPEVHLPMLISNLGNKIVIPHSATRDVLAGRVSYYLVDETGVGLFKPKHMFAALKLDSEKIHHYEDYPCVGAHQWTLEKKAPKRRGLGYRRTYISDFMITRGIYG
ncbi:PREDICTED: uncharacterized protein LOC108563390 [Nicrophorus vespilloides]|uniref:Uncharacterized protein LOC108563390 n=1 Tax=Nicrophorus vespilloides TaxID=110193 RepID=A0ABM1MSJ0_NICVS|nr:PREDICTED: uncharacterized protein LOC108563390 [Nicrophorus vespilloides]